MSNLSIDDVRHVARLARLGMSDDQLVTMADELDTIIDSIGKISELELDDIMPTTHAPRDHQRARRRRAASEPDPRGSTAQCAGSGTRRLPRSEHGYLT